MVKVLAVLLSAICFFLGCRKPYVVEPIVSHATLASGWSEFRPANSLHWSEPEQELAFRIDTPHQIGEHLEIVGPGDEKFVPEVELVADDGKTFPMDTHGFLGGEIVFTFKSKPPALPSIGAIRVRSSLPITISNMVWRGYDPKDAKR